MLCQHELTPPSAWVACWSALIPHAGLVLDLACGAGRHALLLAGKGHRVVAVDRDAVITRPLLEVPGVSLETRDLEAEPWPYSAQLFDAVVVTNYLHRPLFPLILAALKANGVLLYETFAVGNERFGKPSNPDFLLAPGELLHRVEGRLRVIAFEDRYVEQPKPALVQRLCAINAASVPLQTNCERQVGANTVAG